MVNIRRYIAIIDFRAGNRVTSNVEAFYSGDAKNARRIINEKYNNNGRQLIGIRSLRILN